MTSVQKLLLSLLPQKASLKVTWIINKSQVIMRLDDMGGRFSEVIMMRGGTAGFLFEPEIDLSEPDSWDILKKSVCTRLRELGAQAYE